ncbi:VanZ family protein [Clostridium tyrobutyricum]|uniref:VanZ family protein n=1 Tax=Clostridium tyrobutyricum TaxID=1519 RepID=UPI00073D3D6D|nr:VanZ family protein [Clostridium tyrobutyricum]
MKKIVLILICIVWMGMLFYNSSNNGQVSNEKSNTILNDLTHTNKKNIQENNDISKDSSNNDKTKISLKKKIKEAFKVPDNRQEKLNMFVRKNAHVFEYFVLAILVAIAMFALGLKGRGAIVYIMFICLLYAVTDEFHQAFVPGRTSLVSDVIIDFSGSIIGIILFYATYYKLLKKR